MSDRTRPRITPDHVYKTVDIPDPMLQNARPLLCYVVGTSSKLLTTVGALYDSLATVNTPSKSLTTARFLSNSLATVGNTFDPSGTNGTLSDLLTTISAPFVHLCANCTQIRSVVARSAPLRL
ncbi:Hypothetical protein D9617_2g057630 [Elsinoe fawcettii]|nr:Hypothetical protein D9617_2g057630 [Elsinoe fawcettii]